MSTYYLVIGNLKLGTSSQLIAGTNYERFYDLCIDDTHDFSTSVRHFSCGIDVLS